MLRSGLLFQAISNLMRSNRVYISVIVYKRLVHDYNRELTDPTAAYYRFLSCIRRSLQTCRILKIGRDLIYISSVHRVHRRSSSQHALNCTISGPSRVDKYFWPLNECFLLEADSRSPYSMVLFNRDNVFCKVPLYSKPNVRDINMHIQVVTQKHHFPTYSFLLVHDRLRTINLTIGLCQFLRQTYSWA